MNYLKRDIFLLLFIIFLVLSMSCKSRIIKPIPSDGSWEKCHVCNGYGVVEVYKNHNYTKKSEKRDKELDQNLGCCLYSFASHSKQHDKYENQVLQEKQRGTYENHYHPKPSIKLEVEYIKCNFCDGKGWIKQLESEDDWILKNRINNPDSIIPLQ